MVATAILIESGLAFLGLGDPNVMSWDSSLATGVHASGRLVDMYFSGIAILITVLPLIWLAKV